MQFPKEYFDEEVRAGFYIDSKMKSCWAVQLKILNQIDNICRKHNIQYFAEWGTLLGAVRHNGFIPWDDDMDICMKRQDFERFLKIAKNEFPDTYEILDYHDQEEYWDVMARVLNSDEVSLNGEFLDNYYNMPYMCGIDIFPLDYVAKDKRMLDTQRDIIDYVKSVADTNGIVGFEPGELESHLKKIESLCNQKIDRNKSIKIQLYKILCGLYAIYSEKESDEVALMALYLENGGCIYPKEYYSDSIRMPFENITIPVPIGYDHILKAKYGDYMKNIRKGGSHDYPFYEKIEDYLREKNIEIPAYQYPFSKNSVSTEFMQKNKAASFQNILQDKVELLHKIHGNLELLLDYQEADTVLSLLQECQNMAVSMGESIEKKVGEGSKTVTVLESYCEVIYQLYQTISVGNSLPGKEVKQILDQLMLQLEEALEKVYSMKEIVFMPCKASRWQSFEKLWIEACNHPNTIVRVVPIPYYYKKQLGRELSEMYYEGDCFPENVFITSYEEYSIEQNHPDIIYIQEPYDGWNYMYTWEPKYFSDQLYKHTEKLIYVPWFKIDEMNPEDGRGLKSQRYFIPMPGLVYADKVILQSPEMKESYVKYLTEWAGENTKEYWESKIEGNGAYLYENTEKPIEKPAEWLGKKILLYYVSGNSLLEHKGKLLDKINRSMETFVEQKDRIQVLWIQDAYMKERLQPRIPEIWKKYQKIVKQYRKEAWLTEILPEEEKNAIAYADAFYGDGGKYAQEMQQCHKPVMLQNIEV